MSLMEEFIQQNVCYVCELEAQQPRNARVRNASEQTSTLGVLLRV